MTWTAQPWTRRAFLAASLTAASMLVDGGRPSPAAAEASATPATPGRLTLYNIHTREALKVTYRDGAGRYDPGALDRINHLMRCHFTDEVAVMDLRVIEFLNTVDERLGGDREIHVISGYRSPEYNAWLIRHGSGVATHSLHLAGRAVDVRFPEMSLAQVRRTALALRRGGVGYYAESAFVHLDSGRVRSW